MCTPGDRELAQAVGPRHDLIVSEDQLLEARELAQAVGLRRDLIEVGGALPICRGDRLQLSRRTHADGRPRCQ
jgi:hypothetical protein